MAFSPKNQEAKAYNTCIDCTQFGKFCDGPNFLTMDMNRLCEWSRLRKDYLHGLDSKWTNSYISEQSGISKVTIDRFLSGKVDDLKFSTISSIIRVLVDGTWGQYPCSLAAGNEAPPPADTSALIERNKYLAEDVERLKREAVNQRTFLADQIKRKDRYILVLALVVGTLTFMLCTYLLSDLASPDWGLFFKQ